MYIYRDSDNRSMASDRVDHKFKTKRKGFHGNPATVEIPCIKRFLPLCRLRKEQEPLFSIVSKTVALLIQLVVRGRFHRNVTELLKKHTEVVFTIDAPIPN